MNDRIYRNINAFADRMNSVQKRYFYTRLDKVDVYGAVDVMMRMKMTRLCLQMYDRCCKDRSGSYAAVSMFLSSIQYLLPHNYQQTADGKVLESFADQVARLTGACGDQQINSILRFIEQSRNGFVHYGLIQCRNVPAGLFGADDQENWWNLLNCILYTCIFYRKLNYVRPKWPGFAIFRYSWRKVFSGDYTEVRALGTSDGFFGLIYHLLGKVVELAAITLVIAVVLTVGAGIAAIVREIKNAIVDDEVSFCEIDEKQVVDFVTGLSKAERARFIDRRMTLLNNAGNHYKVGDTVRCNEDLVTKALYEMALEERLPNATAGLGGMVTELTFNLSHVPVLKSLSQIPCRHRYLVHDPDHHRRSNVPSNDNLVRSYYNTGLCITGQDVRYGNVQSRLSEVKSFVKAMSRIAQVEYLITGPAGDGNLANVRNSIVSSGVSASRIRTTYTPSGSIVEVKLRILK